MKYWICVMIMGMMLSGCNRMHAAPGADKSGEQTSPGVSVSPGDELAEAEKKMDLEHFQFQMLHMRVNGKMIV